MYISLAIIHWDLHDRYIESIVKIDLAFEFICKKT